MKHITDYDILPSTITDQEKLDYESKIFNKGVELNIIDPTQTTKHSDFVEHPSNGTYKYAKNNTFNKIMVAVPEIEHDDYKPSTNFTTAIDDTLYASDSPEIQDFALEEE